MWESLLAWVSGVSAEAHCCASIIISFFDYRWFFCLLSHYLSFFVLLTNLMLYLWWEFQQLSASVIWTYGKYGVQSRFINIKSISNPLKLQLCLKFFFSIPIHEWLLRIQHGKLSLTVTSWHFCTSGQCLHSEINPQGVFPSILIKKNKICAKIIP